MTLFQSDGEEQPGVAGAAAVEGGGSEGAVRRLAEAAIAERALEEEVGDAAATAGLAQVKGELRALLNGLEADAWRYKPRGDGV